MFTLKDIKFKDILDIKNLEIKKENVTIISGPSGSGKSTLLKMLNNLLSPDEGDIYYKDENIKDLDPINLRRKVLMLPQSPTVFNGTIYDNIKLAFKYSEKRIPDKDTIKKALDDFNLDKDLDDDAGNLSGGEKQKLAIVRIILLKAQVFLLDEPTSALDRENEDEVMEKIIGFAQKEDIKIIMVTHSNYLKGKYNEDIIDISKKGLDNE